MPKRHLRRLYALLALSLVIPLVAQVQVAAQTPPAASPIAGMTYDQAEFRLDQVMQGLTQLDSQLDRSQFDLDALAAKLGFEAQDAVTFVHDQIATEIYPGMLRGAQGTLLSRAGNALDQTTLLATLLTKQGYQVRIERAQLSPEQAQALVNQMAAPRPAAPPIGDMNQIGATLTQIGQAAGKGDQEIAQAVNQALHPADVTTTSSFQTSERDASSVQKALAGAGVTLGDPNAPAELVKEARDYFWVEYREVATSPWVAAHPAFKDGAAVPKGLKPAATFKDVDSLPADIQYRFRLEVTIEQASKGKLTTMTVLSVPDQSVTSLIGVPITFTNYANGIAKAGSTGDVTRILNQSTLFVPMVDGKLDPSARVFDLHGTAYQLNQVKPGEFSVEPLPGAAVSGAVSTAISGIFGEGTATPAATTTGDLTAEWIDYTLTLPDGTTTSFRREVVDRLGPANRAAGKIPATLSGSEEAAKLDLMQHQTLMLDATRFPMGYLLDQAIARFITSRPILEASLQRRYAPNNPVTIPDDVMASLGTTWPGLPPLFYAFAWGAESTKDTVSYRPAPGLVVYREVIAAGPSAGTWQVTNGIDIISNPRRSFSVTSGNVTPAPDDVARAGVWETQQETAIPAPAGSIQFNTTAAFSHAAAASIPSQVISSEADLATSGVSLPPDAMTRLRQDLAAGYVVIVPKALPAGQQMTGWWRVEPKTGTTLGMTSDGRGQTTSEYTLLLTSIACAGYAGFRGWSPGATLGNCGGIVVGYGAAVLGATALQGLIIGVVFVLIADLAG